MTRPRLRADSTKFTGNATCALVKISCAISVRKISGQFSDREANGARIVAGSGAAGAGLGAGGTGRGVAGMAG
jgi:hypothetical protein